MGGKEVNEGQPLPCCFYLCLLLDMLPLGITIRFPWLLTFLFFTIRVQFRFFKKFAFPVQIGRQSFPLAKHQTDYLVSILLVTETHVSMHILHNLLVVPVVVTCSTVCISQYFTCLEHPNILQQTNKHSV